MPFSFPFAVPEAVVNSRARQEAKAQGQPLPGPIEASMTPIQPTPEMPADEWVKVCEAAIKFAFTTPDEPEAKMTWAERREAKGVE